MGAFIKKIDRRLHYAMGKDKACRLDNEGAVVEDRRKRMQHVFRGLPSALPPVCMRLDLWYQDAVSRGVLPEAISGRRIEEIEDMLGFCRSARYLAHPRLVFPAGWVSQIASGDDVVTTYQFPRANLEKVERRSEREKQSGMRGMTVKYPISNEAECRAFIEALEHASVVAPIAGFAEFDHWVGDAGMPILIIGSCPAHWVMLELFGYEQFFYALADYPRVTAEVISVMEHKFRTELWNAVFDSPAGLILHGNHFADATTPPPLFRRFFLPYFREFNERAHAAGKRVLWHSDAAMGSLLEFVLDAGFDGADCLATAPLVPETIEDYDRVWRGRIVCWGGLPGIVFNPEYPERLFVQHLHHLRDYTHGKVGFIVGVSDNVMPGALWERIVAVSDAFRENYP